MRSKRQQFAEGRQAAAGPLEIVKLEQTSESVAYRKSGSDAVALLVFLAGTARARIVAPDFRRSPSGLGWFDRCCARLELHLLLLAALLAFDLFW